MKAKIVKNRLMRGRQERKFKTGSRNVLWTTSLKNKKNINDQTTTINYPSIHIHAIECAHWEKEQWDIMNRLLDVLIISSQMPARVVVGSSDFEKKYACWAFEWA